MKNQKGVTLTSVAIYIIIILVVIGILATISANFKGGIKNANMEGTEAAELNKFNVYFLEEIKKEGNDALNVNSKMVQFKTGKIFIYDSNNKSIRIYDGDNNIEIAKNIETCSFEKTTENEKTIIKVTIKPENSDVKNLEYVLAGKTQDEINEDDYFSEYYTKLSYISVPQRRYIDTGVLAKTGVSAVAKLTIPNRSSACFLGNNSTNTCRFELISFDTYNSTKVWGLGYTQYNYLSAATGSGAMEVESKLANGEQYLKVNGSTLYTGNVAGEYSADSNLYLFACKKADTIDTFYIGRFYYCKIYDNGVLVRDFIPVKDSNEVVCLYDKVEGKFYYNDGQGDFSAGPEI